MKRLLLTVVSWLLRVAISLRYRVELKGLEKLNQKTLDSSKGTLFLPNHPAIFIDPLLATLYIYKEYQPRPMIVEYMYYTPIVHTVMRWIRALPVPGFDTSPNSFKTFRNDRTFNAAVDGLRKGENFLLYPAGRTKNSALEIIGGASGLHRILQEVPDVNIVLVRMTGLWGSLFSRAATGAPPSLFKTFGFSVKTILKNLIFFTPKRKLSLEFEIPTDFPNKAGRRDINRYLEDWYNQPFPKEGSKKNPAGEPLKLVSYSWWKRDYLKIVDRDKEEHVIDLEKVPAEMQELVIAELSHVSKRPVDQITMDLDLATDLGLDSLDGSDLIAFLEERFEVGRIHLADLSTVKHVLGIASGQIKGTAKAAEETTIDPKRWKEGDDRPDPWLSKGKTLPEVFLRNCDRMGKAVACVDGRSGIMTYKDLKLRSLLLADKIRQFPGKNIGIMLPASVGASLLVLAVQLAGKVPVMINWTVGSRHLDTVVDLSHLEVVLTSWAFVDRLDRVDLGPIHEKIFLLEELKPLISLRDKAKALWRSRQSADALIKLLELDHIRSSDTAGILFTSGTEKAPKGVPLTHGNIVSNQRAALEVVDFNRSDVLIAMLPPFHSFGFTLTGILPLVCGIRVVFYPDPTDGPRLAAECHRWGVTLVCGAPTFLKGIFKAATVEQMSSARIVLSGAERCPPELLEMIKKCGEQIEYAEGYGVTECSPVVSVRQFGGNDCGVGKPLPGVRLAIVQEETHEPLSQGERGLILVQGPNVFGGYLKGEELASPFLTLNGAHWYNTGDLGVIDENGCLTISGRLSRFVKVGGEMISLTAIESVLSDVAPEKGWPTDQDGPAIAVCAKEEGDAKAEIFLFTTFPVTVEEVNQTLKAQGFSNLVKISAVSTLPELPVMGTGKVHYRQLEKQYLTEKV